VPAALVLERLLAAGLYGLTDVDTFSLVTGVVVLTSVAAAAAYLPARRASRVDPVTALRYE
jgi:ABC-type antimicrobial peptide transport system permease subunit